MASKSSEMPNGFAFDVQPFYDYTPLDNALSSFRLLELQPLSDDGIVRGTLCTHDFDTGTSYKAISYEWGKDRALHNIELHDTYFKVRTNLHDCLVEYCRRLKHPSKVFVDAVCIDQAAVEERNAQVKLMGKIFAQAEEVFVWLGEHMSDFAHLFGVVESLGRDLSLGQDFFRRCDVPSALYTQVADGLWSLQLPCMKDSEFSDIAQLQYPALALMTLPTGEVIYRLPHTGYAWQETAHDNPRCLSCSLEAFSQHTDSYWSRAWIVQECLVARRASLNGGRLSVRWEHTSAITHQLAQSRPSAHRSSSCLEKLEMIEKYKESHRAFRPVETFASLVSRMKFQQCSDPRDRIYSILGCLYGGLAFDVNYSHSRLQVFASAVKFEMSFGGGFRADGRSRIITTSLDSIRDCLELSPTLDWTVLGQEDLSHANPSEEVMLSVSTTHHDEGSSRLRCSAIFADNSRNLVFSERTLQDWFWSFPITPELLNIELWALVVERKDSNAKRQAHIFHSSPANANMSWFKTKTYLYSQQAHLYKRQEPESPEIRQHGEDCTQLDNLAAVWKRSSLGSWVVGPYFLAGICMTLEDAIYVYFQSDVSLRIVPLGKGSMATVTEIEDLHLPV